MWIGQTASSTRSVYATRVTQPSRPVPMFFTRSVYQVQKNATPTSSNVLKRQLFALALVRSCEAHVQRLALCNASARAKRTKW